MPNRVFYNHGISPIFTFHYYILYMKIKYIHIYCISFNHPRPPSIVDEKDGLQDKGLGMKIPSPFILYIVILQINKNLLILKM